MRWTPLATIAAAEVERRTLLGDLEAAASLVTAIVREQQAGRTRPAWRRSHRRWRRSSRPGPLIRHLVLQLRTVDDRGVAGGAAICHTLGASAVRPLAEALAVEDNSRAIRALREILLGFGAVGRSSVEQLKTSTNPAVRRTAIDLLRVFGGDEALPELAALLGDSDQQVQREAVRRHRADRHRCRLRRPAAHARLRRPVSGRDRPAADFAARPTRRFRCCATSCTNTSPSGVARGRASADHRSTGRACTRIRNRRRRCEFVLYRGIWWAPSRTTPAA